MHKYEIITLFAVHDQSIAEKCDAITGAIKDMGAEVQELYRNNHNLAYFIRGESAAKFVIFKAESENLVGPKISSHLSDLVRNSVLLRCLVLRVDNSRYLETHIKAKQNRAKREPSEQNTDIRDEEIQ